MGRSRTRARQRVPSNRKVPRGSLTPLMGARPRDAVFEANGMAPFLSVVGAFVTHQIMANAERRISVI